MRKIWMVVVVVGCGVESDAITPTCDPLVAAREVGWDEAGAAGAVPSDVLDRVQRPVSGVLDFQDRAEPESAEVVIQFVPTGAPQDFEPPSPGTPQPCDMPHLRLVGSLELAVRRDDGAEPLIMIDSNAMVLAYGPGDAIAIAATESSLALPSWLKAIAESDPQFVDPADYQTHASLVPQEVQGGGAYFWSVLQSDFSVGVTNTHAVDGQKKASTLMDFDPEVVTAQ